MEKEIRWEKIERFNNEAREIRTFNKVAGGDVKFSAYLYMDNEPGTEMSKEDLQARLRYISNCQNQITEIKEALDKMFNAYESMASNLETVLAETAPVAEEETWQPDGVWEE